jgi:hypothetical protein
LGIDKRTQQVPNTEARAYLIECLEKQERKKAIIEALGLQPAVPKKDTPTTKKQKAAHEGQSLSSRRSARAAVLAIPVVAQSMEVDKGDEQQEEEEPTFIAKRIVRTKYIREGGVG